jgi:hypothetical protein
MKLTFFLNSSVCFVLIALLTGCTTVEINSQPDVCSDQRMPSSQRMKCIALFEENNLKTYLDRAKHDDGGLTQTKFTSTTGLVHKAGVEKPVQNPKQIVSFYAETNSDGTPNRGGVMVQGTPTEIMFDQNQKPAYISFQGQPVRLLEFSPNFESNPTQPIKGQGFTRHPEGFSSPLGLLKGWKVGIAEYSIQELKSLFEQYTKDGITRLEFESGIVVEGVIESFTENKSGNYRSPTVITFKDCDVKLGDRFLYRKKWGPYYDMILGTVISETNASADSPAFNPDL